MVFMQLTWALYLSKCELPSTIDTVTRSYKMLVLDYMTIFIDD